MFKKPSQQVITSIVVVFVLVVLLTLVGIGFTKVMNRSLQSSSASQQASAASYAAQSGINDAISYIAKSLQANPNADVSSTQCGTLIDPGGPLEAAAKLSPDGNTAYTCVLVDPNPSSLFYQNLAPYKSQVIKITTAAPLSSLLLSWQASDRTRNQFVPAAKGTVLYDEKTWSDANYAPLLRVSLYPIPVSGDLTNVQDSAKTFFLYPQSGGSNSLAYSSPSGLAPVNCSSKNLGSFSGTADYDCNLVINNLASAGASYFYARLTPFYAQSVIKVKGNDGANQALSFKNVQSVIDVTAKSGSAVKRLQARMDSSNSGSGTDLNISSGSDNAPEFALQTANTLCKRLLIPSATSSPATIDPGSVLNCGLSLTTTIPTTILVPGGDGSSGDSNQPAGGGPGTSTPPPTGTSTPPTDHIHGAICIDAGYDFNNLAGGIIHYGYCKENELGYSQHGNINSNGTITIIQQVTPAEIREEPVRPETPRAPAPPDSSSPPPTASPPPQQSSPPPPPITEYPPSRPTYVIWTGGGVAYE